MATTMRRPVVGRKVHDAAQHATAPPLGSVVDYDYYIGR